jgi:nicotinate-nucleotide adenylyltransferase
MEQAAQRKIGLLGGSFDPIHNGHLLLARDVLEILELDELIFIPNRQSPLKAAPTSAKARFAMIERAIAGEKGFSVSPMELKRPGPSYSIDTVEELQEAHPSADLTFLIGSDSLRDLHRWKSIEQLLTKVTFRVMARPENGDVSTVQLPDPWPERLRNNLITTRQIDISSTEIRQRAKAGKSLNYLVPEQVAAYINAERLYQS